MGNINNSNKIPDWFMRGVVAVVLSGAILYYMSVFVQDHEKIIDHDTRLVTIEKRFDSLSELPSRMTRVETIVTQNTDVTKSLVDQQNTLAEAILTGKVRRPRVHADGGK